MKITDVTVKRYGDQRQVADLAAGREIVVVTLETDEGISGLGYANAYMTRYGPTGDLVATLLGRNLKNLLLGENPLLNERVWKKMYDAVAARLGRRGMVMNCLAAIDFALWDIKGKRQAVPISNLLGGWRERIPTYANVGHQLPPDELAKKAAEYVAMGHTALKIRGSATAVSLDEATQRVKAVREAIGPRVKLMVDVNGTWDADTAIQQLKVWEPYDVYWLEEPVPPEDIPGYVAVRKRSGSTYIAGGEQHAGLIGVSGADRAGGHRHRAAQCCRHGRNHGLAAHLQPGHGGQRPGVSLEPAAYPHPHGRCAAQREMD